LDLNTIFAGQAGGAPVSGTANAGSVSFQAGPSLTFTGTYTASRLEASAPFPFEGFTVVFTLKETKQ
jgi:hypothetical protein